MNKIFSSTIIISITFVLFSGCGSSGTKGLLNIPGKYPGASATRLDEYSLKDEIKYIHEIFGETITTEEINQSWSYLKPNSKNLLYSSSVPDKRNISTFIKILKDRDFNTLKSENTTFETLFSLTRLPHVVYLVSGHYNNDEKPPVNINSLSLLPTDQNRHLHINMIKSIIRTESGISFSTTGNFNISADSKEIINSKISLLHDESLLKTFDIYIVTKLPVSEVEGYIKEWHKNLSYEYEKPEIIDLKLE